MTRRDWWLGVALVVLAILVHAAVPRYDWRHIQGNTFVRIDRWTGSAALGVRGSFWYPLFEGHAPTPAAVP